MEITIERFSKGAAMARGIAVIIDVFRAYSVEAYAFSRGAERIYPIADLEEAYAFKRAHPEYLLAGERSARMPEGFDFGNSPAQLECAELTGKTLIHTTSAGTQGVVAAKNADRILVAALVNAQATAEYIRTLGAKRVSLVCMGYENRLPAAEDEACAEYIRSLLLGTPYDLKTAVVRLRESETSGKRFFIPENQSFAPERDFTLCTRNDIFPFAMEVRQDREGRAYTECVRPKTGMQYTGEREE